MEKCKWCTEEGLCELRCGIADDDSCNGTTEEMRECNYVDDSDYVKKLRFERNILCTNY